MISLDALRADVRANVEKIAVALLGNPTGRDGVELRYGRRGSLALVIAGAKAGTWFDFECREGGDMIALIEREHGCDFVRACEIVAEILARKYDEPPRPRPPRKELSADDKRRRALVLYKEAAPFTGTVAERYLRETRRVNLDLLPNLDHVLRFHPCCPFKGERHPCLLVLWRDIITDEPRAIHRIAIASDLTKLDARSFARTTGATMKFSLDSEVTQGLCVSEGPETALSAMTVEHRGTWLLPMWAMGGTLSTLPVLPGIESLTIAVDRDPINPKTGKPPGEDAAAVCARRWRAAGREVIRLIPKTVGQDFNNIIQQGRS